MAFPYVPSGGVLQQAIDQFRKAFPPKVDSATLKKLGVAPSNEGYVITTLKFLGLVSGDNERTDQGVKLFSTHGDDAFAKSLAEIVGEKYSALFDLHADGAWNLDRDALISFFRASDNSTALVGARQALTFAALATMAGQRNATAGGATPVPRARSSTRKVSGKPQRAPAKASSENGAGGRAALHPASMGDVALTVRIEINLPANGSQATYDNIFKSIRENLLK
jgi:hypothetical protein